MGPQGKTVAALAIVALQASCVRFDLEGQDEENVDVRSTALRISGTDSVVLCPLAASLESTGPESTGSVSIVWAGYPAGDDRLQLMHARVSSRGGLLQSPRGLALLDDELALLTIESTASGLEIHAVQRAINQTLRVELSKHGQFLDAGIDALPVEEQDGALDAMASESCESTVSTQASRLQILRTQVNGELPLFVESFPL